MDNQKYLKRIQTTSKKPNNPESKSSRRKRKKEKKKKRWNSKIPTVTKRGGTVFVTAIGIEGLRALLQKPWQLLVQYLRRQRILHLSDPSVYTKCQTILLFKTIKRATHKERERHIGAMREEGRCQSRI